MILEVCVDNLESALEAQIGGADRIELCGDLSIGGVTPSFKLAQSVNAQINLPVMMMVRPRGGNFCYTEAELLEMEEAIDMAKKFNFQGVVFGILDSLGKIDVPKVEKLIKRSRPMEVTFHRAYDECVDPMSVIDDLILLKVDRLLSSGQKKTAIEGKQLLKEIVVKAGENMSIMPGSGVSLDNIDELVKVTKASEYHGSCKGLNGKTNAIVVEEIKSKLRSI